MMKPGLEDAMRWLAAGDIAPDPGVDPRAAQAAEALDRRARLFAAVFGSQDGEAVLQTILEASLFRAPVDHRLEGEAYLRFAQMREGQNQLAATIVAYLKHAEGLERKVDDGRRGREQHVSVPGGIGDDFGQFGGPGAGHDGEDDGDAAGGWDIAVR